MIVTELYKGQGLGNQLACYIATRVIAKDKDYDFGIMHPEKFKGLDFFQLDFGQKVIGGIKYYYTERKTIHPESGADIRLYDKDLVNILDNTKIDGVMQDEQYFLHRKDEIREWLKVKEECECYDYSDDNTCVINFRGGEYARHKDFFLDKNYWINGVANMLKINKNFRFIVITDDVYTAKKFFPSYDVFHFSIAKDYVVIKNAKYLILSNSSFAWFPAWLNENLKFCIAPKYWGRHNVSDGYWSCGYNITQGWMYQDKEGKLSDYNTCLKELNTYIENHKSYYNNQQNDNTNKYQFEPSKSNKNIVSLLYRKVSRLIPNRIKNIIFYARQPLDFNIKKREKTWLSKSEIAEYKKTIKVYDIFYFFNELDLLEIRLNILNDYVDYFVIIESTESFSGLPHTLCFKENLERFAKWKDKIIYYVVDDFPNDKELLSLAKNNSNVGDGEHYWVREFYQKESAKKALLNLKDSDIVFISDCDEIWNPLRLKELTDLSKSEIIRPKQLAYYYYLNNRCSEINGWTGTIVTQYKTIKDGCINDLRTRKKTRFVEIDFGGWHFGFMGGVKGAMKKLTEWQHPEYMSWIPTLEKRVNKNTDYRGRKYKFWTDESDLPEYLLNNKERYKDYYNQPVESIYKYNFLPSKINRIKIINTLIEKSGYKTYLEIGVNTPAQPGYSHDSINIPLKHGVDPNVDTTYRMTSDEFFEKHIHMNYDIIFIDGLHIFEQAYRDIVNSLKWLNDNGTIVVHDCNPTRRITQKRDRISSVWHGDVWKAILKLRMEEPNITIYTINADEGCAIIKKGQQELFKLENNNIDAYTFNFFKLHKKEILNLISVKEFKQKLGIPFTWYEKIWK